MPEVSEDLLHFIWQYRLLKPVPLITLSGNEVKIIRQGALNRDSGPDFFNAQIKLNNMVLAGNIELHVRTSDWRRHGHQHDPAYENIILHVVFQHDEAHDSATEVLELKHYVSEEILEKYSGFERSGETIACAAQLGRVNRLTVASWVERMAVERLEHKVKGVDTVYEACDKDLAQTFYILLLRNFGFKVNSQPFEMLALQLPVNVLLRHRDNEAQVQALLLGMAGMLDEHFSDKNLQQTQNEFEFLRAKYKLVPLEKKLFKFSRLRPANFPGLRLAQFSALLCSGHQLLTSPHECRGYSSLMELLMVKPQGYWSHHYNASGEASKKELMLGTASAENIIINSIAPFLFFYGRRFGKEEPEQHALKLLEQCAFEKNAKTKLFGTQKEVLKTALAGQGLINLYDQYCTKKACLKCGIGAAILKPQGN